MNVLALVKDGQRYVFLYDDQSVVETLNILGMFAKDPELSFSWYDAATLSQRVRDLADAQFDPEQQPDPERYDELF